MKLTAIIVSATVITGVLCGCAEEKKSYKERTTRVVTGKMEKRTLRRQIPLQGTVMPVEYATISAKISGTLETFKVDEGDRRKAGDMLFGIDRQILKNQLVVKEDEIKVREAALQSAGFALTAAEINCRQAKHDYERALTLRESKAISQANFESAETAYKKAQTGVQSAQAEVANVSSQLKQAQSNLAIARKNLADSVITAPFDCVITDKYVEENEFVSTGQKILKLENPDELEIICYISAVYYNQITTGSTAVEILDNSGNVCGRAVVSYKSPAIDPESRTFKLKIRVPKEIPLVSGMLCEMKIILEEKNVYSLPAEAVLLRANNRMIAYTVNSKGRAESVDIERGIVDGNYCEIINYPGVAGKCFIVSGQTFVNNGALLTIVNSGENK